MRRSNFETRPSRDVGASQDQDVETISLGDSGGRSSSSSSSSNKNKRPWILPETATTTTNNNNKQICIAP